MSKNTIRSKNITRKEIIIDASQQSLGRLASKIASLLMGKHRLDYTYHQDKGDTVIVKNIEKIKWTGKKIEQKKYYSHSGYPGGLKIRKLKDLWKKKPKDVLRRAVAHMLPKNRLQKERIKRLKIE